MERISNLLYKDKFNFIYFFCLLALLTVAMFTFYNPFHIGADTMFHYNRLNILMEAIANTTYPTYIDYNSLEGYGYTLNLFYPDLLILPFAIIGNLTTLNTAFITLLITCTLLTGIFTYLAIKNIYKSNFIAIVAALLFTFAAYRIFDVFYRGAIGEYMAFTFIPLALWGVYEVIKGNFKRWYILAIAFSLLIYTHVISSAIVFMVLLIYLLVNIKTIIKEYKRLLYLLLTAIVTLFITSSYIIPMMEQMLSNSFYFTSNPSTDITYSLSKMNDIIYGMFNNIESEYKSAPEPKIGGLLIVLLFIRIAIRNKLQEIKHIDIWVVIGFIFIFSASYSFPWHLFPFNKFTFIQHPCRLLLIVSFIFSLAGAYYLNQIINTKNGKIISILALSIVLIIIMKSDGASNKIIFQNHPKLNNEIAYDLTVGGAEYLPEKFPSPYQTFIQNRGNNIVAQKESTLISNININKGNIDFEIEVDKDDKLELPLTYYIGYKATIDNENIEYKQSDNGLIEVPIDKSGTIKITYTGTIIQKVCFYITIISIILFTIFIILYNRKNNKLIKS